MKLSTEGLTDICCRYNKIFFNRFFHSGITRATRQPRGRESRSADAPPASPALPPAAAGTALRLPIGCTGLQDKTEAQVVDAGVRRIPPAIRGAHVTRLAAPSSLHRQRCHPFENSPRHIDELHAGGRVSVGLACLRGIGRFSRLPLLHPSAGRV